MIRTNKSLRPQVEKLLLVWWFGIGGQITHFAISQIAGVLSLAALFAVACLIYCGMPSQTGAERVEDELDGSISPFDSSKKTVGYGAVRYGDEHRGGDRRASLDSAGNMSHSTTGSDGGRPGSVPGMRQEDLYLQPGAPRRGQ